MAFSARPKRFGNTFPIRIRHLAVFLVLTGITLQTTAQVPLEGFVPFVGMGLTDEFVAYDPDSSHPQLFFVSQPSDSIGGQQLGIGGPHYAVALFDTGAATHVLTHQSSGPNGFDLSNTGFRGDTTCPITGTCGIISLDVNDPLGVYAAGMQHGTFTDGRLEMDSSRLRGQISFSTLSPKESASWELPNIVGLPMVAAHSVHLQNSVPVIFDLGNDTMRTPQIDFHPVGGGGQGIARRASLKLQPKFAQGPFYHFDVGGISEGRPFHENPTSPSVVENGALFIDLNIGNGGHSLEDAEFLLDTGASLTVLSTDTAFALGIDVNSDAPEFTVAVEGPGGVASGIPGYILDTLSINTLGGSFELSDVPIGVLDVTNPNDPGNLLPGILGMNVFADRDIVIDANPILAGEGFPPSLYISDPVTTVCEWTNTKFSGDWFSPEHWSGNVSPDVLCNVRLANTSGSNQQAIIAEGMTSTVNRVTVGGSKNAEMAVVVEPDGELMVYAGLTVEGAGRLHLESNATSSGSVNAQFLALEDGSLTGSGDIWVGAGPLPGSVRNLNGLIAPGDPDGDPIGSITIGGDVNNQGTIAFDLGGAAAGEYDTIHIRRNIYLEGGTLDVDLDHGFMPAVGDTFEIITVGNNVGGTFGKLILPGGFTWEVSYGTLDMNVGVELEVTGFGLICDSDGDGDCDLADLNTMYSVFGTSRHFDFDGNGIVDPADIQGWLDAASDPANPTKLSSTDVFVKGDINFDGKVDSDDLGTLLNNFGSDANLGWDSGNFNGDALVDSTDLGELLNNYGHESAAPASVPEPGSLALLLLGLGPLVGRCRSRLVFL